MPVKTLYYYAFQYTYTTLIQWNPLFYTTYLMFLLEVLYSSETLAIVWGVCERLVFLYPLYLSLHFTIELLQFERILQLLLALSHWLQQPWQPVGECTNNIEYFVSVYIWIFITCNVDTSPLQLLHCMCTMNNEKQLYSSNLSHCNLSISDKYAW